MNYSNLIYTKSSVHLNITAFSNLNLLTLKLTSLLVYKPDYIQYPTFYALVNLESTHYFVNIIFT